MREIKFRAWEKNLKEMISVDSINFEAGLINMELAWRTFEEIELMQYTGLKDSNGVEIYEGDILQNDHHFEYQVLFKGDCWRCEPLKRNGFKNRFIGSDLKIIGNVYENPELLED